MKVKKIITIVLIIILIIALMIMTRMYFIMKESAKEGLESTLQLAEELFDANVKIEKLEEDIENLKNGKEINTYRFLAKIKEIKEEKGKTILVLDGADENDKDEYKGDLNIIIEEETKILLQKEECDTSKLKIGQKVSILDSGKTVTKHEARIAPFIYEIEILDDVN